MTTKQNNRNMKPCYEKFEFNYLTDVDFVSGSKVLCLGVTTINKQE